MQAKSSAVEAEPASTSSHVSLSGHSHKYLSWSSLPPINSEATDLAISNLDHCVINLLSGEPSGTRHAISALHARNLVNTVLILPLINGSALMHDLTNCTIVLGCHQVCGMMSNGGAFVDTLNLLQFRMHASSDVNVYLTIQSNPIIEHCSSVAFAGYPSSLLPSDRENAILPDVRGPISLIQ